mmetsp:Transcript_33101/g.102549  ORF Transcript_33101/g.102549 Transcript_33101/m.102549 type:complete len:93 (+) Transcript_33101:223-501(+)
MVLIPKPATRRRRMRCAFLAGRSVAREPICEAVSALARRANHSRRVPSARAQHVEHVPHLRHVPITNIPVEVNCAAEPVPKEPWRWRGADTS